MTKKQKPMTLEELLEERPPVIWCEPHTKERDMLVPMLLLDEEDELKYIESNGAVMRSDDFTELFTRYDHIGCVVWRSRPTDKERASVTWRSNETNV